MLKNKKNWKSPKVLVGILLILLLLFLIIWIYRFFTAVANSPTEIKDFKIKGMEIESLYIKDKTSILVTTGGLFRVDLENGTIEIEQRIGEKRLLAKILLDKDWASTLTAPIQDGFDCVWGENSSGNSKMIISGDSTIRFFNIKRLTVEPQFSPIHSAINNSNGGLLVLDNEGGLAIIPPKSSSDKNWPKTFENNIWKLETVDSLPLLFIGLCPPRQFDWDSSFLPVVHYSSHVQRYPTDEQIIAYSKYAKVLEMHSWIWQNRYDPNARDEKGEKFPEWRDSSSRAQNYKWIPDDEKELKRVIKTAHTYGMKIIPYVNFLSEDSETPMNEIFERQMTEMRRLKDVYGFDGLYLDGLYYKDPEFSYKAVQTLRELFGEDGWLTLHDTHNDGYFFPFVNTYMDFIITSEHESFNRWASTSYKISNAIASIWPEIPIEIKDGREFLKKLVDDSLLFNNRVLLMAGKDGQWRMWRLYFTEDEMKFMQGYYLEVLKTMKKNGYEKFILETGDRTESD